MARPNKVRTPQQYHPYVTAKALVQSLGILSLGQYREYTRSDKRDPLMPTDPARIYADEWEGWAAFCGKSQYAAKYPTYEQASAAAQRLNIESKQAYQARYIEDSQLPIAPERVYAADWKGWTRFLGGVDAYETLQEAAEAARKLKCTTSRDYDAKRSNDPRLPSAPDRKYKNWTGWADFLGN